MQIKNACKLMHLSTQIKLTLCLRIHSTLFKKKSSKINFHGFQKKYCELFGVLAPLAFVDCELFAPPEWSDCGNAQRFPHCNASLACGLFAPHEYSACGNFEKFSHVERRIFAPSPRGSDTKIKYTRQTNTVRLRSLLDIKRRRITSLYRKRLSRVGYMQTKRQLDN
jgi:hypothetical protein